MSNFFDRKAEEARADLEKSIDKQLNQKMNDVAQRKMAGHKFRTQLIQSGSALMQSKGSFSAANAVGFCLSLDNELASILAEQAPSVKSGAAIDVDATLSLTNPQTWWEAEFSKSVSRMLDRAEREAKRHTDKLVGSNQIDGRLV